MPGGEWWHVPANHRVYLLRGGYQCLWHYDHDLRPRQQHDDQWLDCHRGNGHVTCDGSDITVTVPGVNGASGSVDASATMTLRTGDVNADGVVGTADLKEIRMEVGRGLVNDDNFRDDITVDGKVNHGDTTLEKSKL